ncbi:hypothetical protein B0T18DRAFT_401167 [Schizothecium vesticola]|uniref:Uncharacterized protein n=1 Tax=Schizothecium vesticola TaxID=314040 RepID=A0AA40K9Z3_9PEZI|nr:hypothetical protein B0T18DRAFT_401167 [Schizothecium vesticola]
MLSQAKNQSPTPCRPCRWTCPRSNRRTTPSPSGAGLTAGHTSHPRTPTCWNRSAPTPGERPCCRHITSDIPPREGCKGLTATCGTCRY